MKLSIPMVQEGLGGGWGGGGVKQFFFFLKFDQIWCVSHSHECHVQWHNFFVPAPWGLGEGPKGQISLNFNQRFLNQTLWVVSQMKDIKHIRQDSHSVAWVMPQRWDLGCWGVKNETF